MAWQDEMTAILRQLLNDPEATQYTDDRLQQVLAVGAFQVLQEVTFTQSYRVSVYNVTITPDPTLDMTLDDSFTNLACLKAAAITDKGAAIIAANRAISVKDGSSSVDLRGILKGKIELLKLGWGAAYEDAKLEFLANSYQTAGAAVMSPFRLFALGDWGPGVGDRWNRPIVY